MSDIELVIKIPEDDYNFIKRQVSDGITNPLKICIANGTLLPKGHGDLIDIKDLRQDIIAHKYSNTFCEVHHIDQSINVGMVNILLADAPIIIGADTESEG